jgi:hypothetical protein
MRKFNTNWTAQYDQTCQHCGASFKSKNKVAKYCSKSCKNRAWRGVNRKVPAVIEIAVKGQTVTRVKRGRQEFFLPCDIPKAKRIYGDGYSYKTIENYVRSDR